jgi:hypothetical protein
MANEPKTTAEREYTREEMREACLNNYNAAIVAVHHMVTEVAAGRGPLWDGAENGGEVLDRLPNAIWEMLG